MKGDIQDPSIKQTDVAHARIFFHVMPTWAAIPEMAMLNLGDLLALASGVLFSPGALKARQENQSSVFERPFAFFLFSAFASAFFILVPTSPTAGPAT